MGALEVRVQVPVEFLCGARRALVKCFWSARVLVRCLQGNTSLMDSESKTRSRFNSFIFGHTCAKQMRGHVAAATASGNFSDLGWENVFLYLV